MVDHFVKINDMRHLNYNHLFYFWMVAKEGSIARASELIHITPQTISGQLRLLEDAVGEELFRRKGRGLVLTETGRIVKIYADEIFSLGAELSKNVRNQSAGLPRELTVGIVNAIPKLIAFRILSPALDQEQRFRIICKEGDLEQLLGDLAIHKLDLVISDRPIPSGLNVKAYNHKLGDSPIAFFAQNKMARRFSGKFPNSLNGAPVLLPVQTNEMRRSLDDWFEKNDILPNVIAEFDDSALLKAFGEAGIGVFPAPTVIEQEIQQMYHSSNIGVLGQVTESYYAISPERKLKHPGILKITENARSSLFEI